MSVDQIPNIPFRVSKMESTSSRDARKQKILQKGSDRMAFITGRAPSLESPPSHTQQIHVGADCGSDTFGHSKVQPEKDDKSSLNQEFLTKIKGSSQVPEPSYISEISGTPASKLVAVSAHSPASSSIIPNTDQEICQTQPKSRSIAATFSARKISSCIIASEPTRSICSLTIALLVVFSYIDKPVFGWNLVKSESIVASRPLYILLLTDISIIFARLHLERQKILEYADEDQTTSTGREGQTWAGAVTVLENGLVVYQTIRAIFIDLSIYTVVVVLGLSFV